MMKETNLKCPLCENNLFIKTLTPHAPEIIHPYLNKYFIEASCNMDVKLGCSCSDIEVSFTKNTVTNNFTGKNETHIL